MLGDGAPTVNNPAYLARELDDIPNPPGPRGEPTWRSRRIGVYRTTSAGDQPVGQYVRNYPTFFHTFFPFRRRGIDYALYSPDYTCTRLLALPECVDLGGEAPHAYGFCPIDYYVPCFDDATAKEQDLLYVNCGFVAGCVWGEDSSYKIQFLDLSRVHEGVLTRDDRFGYIVLPEKVRLADAVSTHLYDPRPDPGQGQQIAIAVQRAYDIPTGRDTTDD